ncbi:hypothetical protein KR074_002676, partial [Drosophila pseudoananassae]
IHKMLKYNLLVFLCAVADLAFCKPLPNRKIIGGEDVSIENAPWQVSIQAWSGKFCGGSILSPYIILTAAHCVIEDYPQDLEVRVGSSYMDFDGFLIEVSSIVCHEDYDSTSYDNDVALVVLSEPLDLGSSDSISYIELAKDVPTPGSQAFVTGWGYTEYGSPEVLQYLQSKIVDPEKCKEMYTDYNTLTEKMLCATAEERGTCRGDSGGALVLDNHQVGIVSWAGDCADPLFPTVYASVPALRDWIESTSNAILAEKNL